MADGTKILPADLPAALRAPRLLPTNAAAARAQPERDAFAAPAAAAVPEHDTWSLADVEREHILRVLARHDGNATSAAKQLGISRTTLWRKLREYGLSRKG